MLNFIRKTKIKGFTLAEVLITLGILGIVAEMTLPSLINNTNKSQYTSALLKTYSVLGQTQQQIEADNGEFESAIGSVSDSEGLANLFIQKMKVAKNCGVSKGNSDCFSKVLGFLNGAAEGTDGDGNSYHMAGWTVQQMLDGSPDVASIRGEDVEFITADGIAYSISLADKNIVAGACTSDNPVCGLIVVDVNGPKKGPSMMGRDLYLFWIATLGVVPGGAYESQEDIDAACSPNTPTGSDPQNGNGFTCAEKVISAGAMNY